MHGLENSGLGVPAFLAKLWRLVDDPETNSLIYWSQVRSLKISLNQIWLGKKRIPLKLFLYNSKSILCFVATVC